MITVMGATGHTGKKITEALLKAGEKVRALGRSESKLVELKSSGADVLAGDTTDATFLAKAFRGADAAYTLLPTDRQSPDYRAKQDQEGKAILKAIRESGVRCVVALNSLGADLSEGTGVIRGLREQEERLKQLKGANVLLLRPVSFFENFYDHLGLMKHQGIIADSVAPDLAVPMVAARDIADVAATALRASGWKGVVVRELLGQRDLTYAEATRILGERIGKPDLTYVHLSYTDMAKSLLESALVLLDTTILCVAFHGIRSSFAAASTAALSWVLNAYTIVFGTLLVPAGRLADWYGRKKLFLVGVTLFRLASALCGWAVSALALIDFRVLHAVGAALLMPASLALILAAFPREKRSIAVSLWGASARWPPRSDPVWVPMLSTRWAGRRPFSSTCQSDSWGLAL